MAAVEQREPTQEDAEYLAAHMRQADIDECAAASGQSPLEAVVNSIESSCECRTLLLCGEVAAIWGVVRLAEGHGLVWMLTTDAVGRHRDAFALAAQQTLPELLDRWPKLSSAMHGRNWRSLRWGERLGFRFDPPEPFGPHGELFHRFHVTKETLRV